MKERIVLIGGGGHCRSAIDVIEQQNNFLIAGIVNKKELVGTKVLEYKKFFSTLDISFIEEPDDSKSNYWLQAVLLQDVTQRDELLDFTNKNGVMSRPIWKLMNELEMFKDCQKTTLENAKYLEERVVNIPSSVII